MKCGESQSSCNSKRTALSWLMALCIAGVIALAVQMRDARPYFGEGSVSSTNPHRAELVPLNDALTRAAIRNGFRFPRRLEEMLDVTDTGKPLLASADALRDEFGNDFDMRVKRDGDEETCELWSLGRDGRRGGTDDVLEMSLTASRSTTMMAVPVSR